MNLKLKDGYEECMIYIPFENRNCLGKFINPSLYKYLYNISPELFDVITEVKKTTNNDILINNTKPTGSSNTEGEIA